MEKLYPIFLFIRFIFVAILVKYRKFDLGKDKFKTDVFWNIHRLLYEMWYLLLKAMKIQFLAFFNFRMEGISF